VKGTAISAKTLFLNVTLLRNNFSCGVHTSKSYFSCGITLVSSFSISVIILFFNVRTLTEIRPAHVTRKLSINLRNNKKLLLRRIISLMQDFYCSGDLNSALIKTPSNKRKRFDSALNSIIWCLRLLRKLVSFVILATSSGFRVDCRDHITRDFGSYWV
jgi:hypothetical protein